MKAAVVTEDGVKVQDVEKPHPGPEQVLVRVRAAGLNRADLQVASGKSHGRMGPAGRNRPRRESARSRQSCTRSSAWSILRVSARA